MIVYPTGFAVTMADRCKEELNIKVNDRLRDSHIQIAETFNDHILKRASGWSVLQPPTGSGKTRGLETYCSMLPDDEFHPGVLIVTKFKAEATEIADNINRLSDDVNRAVAYHSDNQDMADRLGDFPVLVITHAGYKIWLQSDGDYFKHDRWCNGERKLVVIDECLDIIEHKQVHVDDLSIVRGIIPAEIASKYPDVIKWIDHMLDKMNLLKDRHKTCGSKISPDEWSVSQDIDFKGFFRSMGRIRFDEKVLEKKDDADHNFMAAKYREVILTACKLTKEESWYAKKGDLYTFNMAKVIVPKDKMNAVIMDATASCNVLYKLLGNNNVNLITAPEGIRSYSNVNIYASIGHRVGKTVLEDKALEQIPNVISEVSAMKSKKSKILICAHKSVEPSLYGYTGLGEYSIMHWGDIDGKNNWQDFGSALIYGLPYLDNITPQASLMAIERWRGRKFKDKIRDIVIKRIANSHITSSLVQAMNRIRCRRIVDGEGNCYVTDFYMLLPSKPLARVIMDTIVKEMPNVNIVTWQSSAIKRRVKRSKYEKALITWLENKKRGSYMLPCIKYELGIPDSSFDRLVKKVKDEASELYQELADIGVYHQQRGCGEGGRGNKSWLEKVPVGS